MSIVGTAFSRSATRKAKTLMLAPASPGTSPPGMERPREQITTTKPDPSALELATDLANVIKSQLQLDETSATHSSDRELVRWDVIFRLRGFRFMRLQDEALHAIPLEAVVHDSDILYKLYRDCLQYFKKMYPFPLESPCSILAAFRDQWRHRKRQPTEFLEAMARLVMEVVNQSDNWPMSWPTMHHHQFHLITGPDSLMTFLAALVRANEIIAKVEGFTHWHLSCELLNGWLQRYFYDPEFVYQALFIDWLTQASWFELGRWRRTTGVKLDMYGMFGTRGFIEEAEMTEEAENSQAEPVSEQIPSLEAENLPGLAGNGCALDEVFAGIPSPVDIPWLDGVHDGRRHCGSLREYAMARRPWHEGLLTMRWDDLALWLSMVTFGLLEAVTHTRIAESLLLVPGDRHGRYVLSGTRLLQILAHWRATLRSATADPEVHLHRGRVVAGALRETLSTLEGKKGAFPIDYSTAGSAPIRAGVTDAEGRDLHYSVALFVVSLGTIAALQVWSTLPELDYLRMILRRQVESRLVGFFDFECRRRMRSEGWCPYTSEKIWRMHPNPLVTSATLARLPRPATSGVSRREHAQCTLWTCSFHNLPTYTRRHIDASCQCDYAKPSLEHIAILLSNDLVPVMIWDGTSLRVVPANITNNSFVAISHVWADGMGSTSEDGLPVCVVERLSSLAKGLSAQHGAFWIDSLCVPRARELRKRAIALMARTYSDAGKVLVIASDIRSHCSKEKPWCENLLRIAMSTWMCRVWTLQEALLARDLYFEFADGPIDVEEKLGLKTPPVDGEDGGLRLDVVDCLPCLPVFQHRREQRGARGSTEVPLGRLTQLVCGRTIAKAADEVLAIASLVPRQVDIVKLLQECDGRDVADRRMRSFLLQMRTIPPAIIMCDGPRLPLPGFTWAPRTLTRVDGVIFDLPGLRVTGTCTESGLIAELFVATFTGQRRSYAPLIISAFPYPSDKREHWSLVGVQRSSQPEVAYRFSHDLPLPPATVDALLFCEGTLPLPNSPGMPCIAVTSLDKHAPQASGASYDNPRPFKHRGWWSCNFVYRPSERQCEVLGELEKTWVKLV
ncbi:hypothetical protein FKP32DRAFT_1076298 [Trametes sanguinea]|nr:hypothetical protein FKP32DRAFT_1076298 [Trametes sanguinea]